MNKIKSILFLLSFLMFLSFGYQLQAQQMSGVIFDDMDNTPISSAIIQNLSSKNATTSDERGAYRLMAKYGDSILVKMMDYGEVRFVVREAGKTEFVRNVYLKPVYGQMQEYVVSQLSPYQRDSMARRNLYGNTLEREGEWISGAAAVFSPASALAQLVSKKARQRKRFINNFHKWEEEKFIQSRYTPELVLSVVPLNEDSLAKFMYQYPIAGDFARAATDVELKMWIRYNYLDWTDKIRPTPIDTLKPKQ